MVDLNSLVATGNNLMAQYGQPLNPNAGLQGGPAQGYLGLAAQQQAYGQAQGAGYGNGFAGTPSNNGGVSPTQSGYFPMDLHAAPTPTRGWVEGYLAAQDNRRKNMEQANLNQAQANSNDTHQMTKTEWLQKQVINAGMIQAAQQGGYGGAIEYLRTADPERALSFEKQKTDLDRDIMTNDVMKNISIPSMQQDALMESYGKLGKISQALLKAPVQDRQNMYTQMLPIVKTIVPGAPDDVNSFAPLGALAIAQATPANLLFQAHKQSAGLSTKVGQALDDVHKAVSTYGADSPEAQAMTKNYQDALTEQAKNNTKIAGNQAGSQSAYNSLNSQNMQLSKDFNVANQAYSQLKTAYIDPPTSTAAMGPNDAMMAISLARLYAPNIRINPKTMEVVSGGESLPSEVLSNLAHVQNGGTFNPEHRKAMMETADKAFQAKLNVYNQTQGMIKQSAISRGLDPSGLLNPVVNVQPSQNIAMPQLTSLRDQKIAAINAAQQLPINQATGQPFPSKQAAIDAVNQKYQAMVQSAGQQQQQVGTDPNQVSGNAQPVQNFVPKAAEAQQPVANSDPNAALKAQILQNQQQINANAQALNSDPAMPYQGEQ